MGTFLDKYGLLRNGKPKTPITIREIIGKTLATKKVSSPDGPIGDLNKTFSLTSTLPENKQEGLHPNSFYETHL